MTRPNRMVHCIEEETKARSNLGKLIHTAQHLPSERYRVNAQSLWGLIGELESFEAPRMSEFVRSHKPSKKSFSRKYLDLRLYPSPDRSSVAECDLKAYKPEKQQVNKLTKKKKTDLNTWKLTEINETSPYLCQEVNTFRKLQNKPLKENIPRVDKKKVNFTQNKVKTQPKCSNHKPLPLLNPEENYLSRKFINESPKNTPTIPSKKCNPILSEKHCELKILDKFKRFPSSGLHQNKLKSSKMLGGSTVRSISKEAQIKKDQASMVKKLTSYWNNLLNNDIEESSSALEAVGNVNKSLQDIARSTHRQTKNRHGKNWLLSRTRSESSVHILKNLDLMTINTLVMRNEKRSLCFNQSSDLVSSSRDKYEIFSRLREDLLSDIGDVPESTKFLDVCKTKFIEDTRNQAHNEREITKVGEMKLDFKIQNAIETMQKLVRKLEPFRSLSLTSEQINLSHSLRALLCLMTATVLSSDKQTFESYDEKENTNYEDIVESCLQQTQKYPANDVLLSKQVTTKNRVNKPEGGDTTVENNNVALVPVQGITQRKVEDALRYLTLWKDYLWTEFVLSPRVNENGFYGWSKSSFSPQNFTVVIEEEIVLENNCSEEYDDDIDDSCREYDTEDEDDENLSPEVVTPFLGRIHNVFDSLIDWIFDIIILYWPESFQELVTNIYQLAASILVLWVIIKEVLGK